MRGGGRSASSTESSARAYLPSRRLAAIWIATPRRPGLTATRTNMPPVSAGAFKCAPVGAPRPRDPAFEAAASRVKSRPVRALLFLLGDSAGLSLFDHVQWTPTCRGNEEKWKSGVITDFDAAHVVVSYGDMDQFTVAISGGEVGRRIRKIPRKEPETDAAASALSYYDF